LGPNRTSPRAGLRGHAAISRIVGLLLGVGVVLAIAGCGSTQHGATFDDQNHSPAVGGPFDPTTLKTKDPRSLFVKSNYRKAFALVERKLGARAEVEDAELYPGQLELTVLSHHKERWIAVQYNGEYGSKPAGPMSADSPTFFPLSDLAGDPPAVLTTRLEQEAALPVARVRYMIVSRPPGASKILWMVYTTNPNLYFTANSATGPIQEQKGMKEPITLQ
jgi:hypothetical protein